METLTTAQEEVLKLKALGFIDKEIADKRCVSAHTVRTQIKRILKKSNARSMYHLVAKYAAQNPSMFKTMALAFCMTAQVASMSNTEDTFFKVKRAKRTVKVRRHN